MFKKAIQILEATIGIQANKEELLPALPCPSNEIHSLLTDFHEVKEIEYSKNMDGEIQVKNNPQKPNIKFHENKASLTGPFLELNNKTSDMRYSLWGNQGFLYRFTLYLLEKYHSIYNFHACALFDDKNEILYIVMGETGSGKTVFLLKGILEGLKIFSTETLHCQIKKRNIKFYMGSLVDNVRFSTLVYHFPQFLRSKASLSSDEIWERKIALDLSSYKSKPKILKNPQKVFIIFPRVEEGRKHFHLSHHKNKDKVYQMLFTNLSQKISQTFLLYHQFPVPGFDDKDMAAKRLQFIQTLLNQPSLKNITSILTDHEKCWEKFLI
jgi:hypothetical protein